MGVFDLGTPVLLIRDPELIKRVMVTDFEHFQNHNFIVNESMDVLFGHSLFQMKDKMWRDMRSALSPVFTGSKMKIIVDSVVGVAKNTTQFAENQISSEGVLEMEMKEFFSRFTADVMAEYSYGIEVNSHENPLNEFYLAGMNIKEVGGPWIMMKIILNKIFPSLYRKLNLSVFDGQLMKFFQYLLFTTWDHRTKNNVRRPDLLQTLLDMKNNPKDGRKWTDDQLMSQSFIFFLGGFDTLSTMLAFTCYEFATNPLVQEKAYQEMLEVSESLEGERISYEHLGSMKYLSMVFQEVLRMRPPVASLDRVTGKDYNLKDEETGLDYTIKKGSTIWLPLLGIQMDPKYYTDPEKFEPERWATDENNNSKKDSVPLMTFGLGPRSCIGNRFALFVAKVIIYHLLLKFEFVVIEKTQIPIKIVPNLIGLQSEKGIWVGLKERKN